MKEHVFEQDVVYRTFTRHNLVSSWGFGRVAKLSADNSYSRRFSPYLIVVFVLRGSGRFVDGRGEEFRVAAGDALIHWPHTPCSLEIDADGLWRECWLQTDDRFGAAMAKMGIIDPSQTCLRIGLDSGFDERVRESSRLLRAIEDREADRFGVRMHELLVDLNNLAGGRNRDDSEYALIQSACRILARETPGSDSVPRVSEHLGVGYERFRKLFKQYMGVPPGEYRILRRIDRARELLRQSDLNSKQVAEHLGYADQFSFSKQFKRVVGESPELFRRRTR